MNRIRRFFSSDKHEDRRNGVLAPNYASSYAQIETTRSNSKKPLRQSGQNFKAGTRPVTDPPLYDELDRIRGSGLSKPTPIPIDATSTFWESGSDLPLPRFDPEDILIAVMGMTGAGKTSFISRIAGVDMKIGHDLFSCTKNVGIASVQQNGRRIHFIDTPGFDDTDLKDADILEVIALYLTNTRHRKIRLSGILYLHRITDPRVGGQAVKNIRLFRGLVGNRSMGNVALITTMWGQVSVQDGTKRMNQLAHTDDFWGSMIASGATCDKYDGTKSDGSRIVNKLLAKTPCILQIQAEMEGGASLTETTAGKEVNDRIAEIEASYKKEIDKLRLEMKEAQDANVLRELLDEQQKARERMEEAQKAKNKLLEATIAQQTQQIHELQNSGGCVIL